MRTGTCDRCGEGFVDESAAQTRRFCSENCRKRQHAWQNERQMCLGGCGKLVWTRKSGYCFDCSPTHQRHLERWDRIEELWADGYLIRDIAERLDTTEKTIRVECFRMRAAGRDLPYRRVAT